MRRELLRLFGVSFFSATSVACAAGGSTAPLLALEKQVHELRAQVARQDDRLATMSAEVQIMRETARAERPPPSLEVVRLQPPPAVEPPPEEPQEEPVLLELSGEADRLAVVEMPPPPRAAGRAAPSPARPSESSGSAHAASEPVDLAAEAELRTALSHYRRGDADEAYRRLSELVRAQRTGPLAEQARYWMGEIQFEKARYLVAIEEYTRLQKDFPRSSKVADALLKVGLAYERLGDARRARGVFAELLSAHPESAGAELARKKVKP